MIKLATITALLFAAACGGSSDKKTTPDPETSMTDPNAPDPNAPVDPTPAPEPEPAPVPEPPPPPPPKVWKARASLAMVSGTKQAPANIVFTETEGQSTSVTSEAWFVGLKPGKYHLVIHEGAECGKKAAGAGKPWAMAADVALQFEVTKESEGNIDVGTSTLKVDGADTVSGKTLVLHDDKKGKPGKAVACGPITLQADEAPAAEPETKTP
jgi:Cu/Zn superoxide dismutase